MSVELLTVYAGLTLLTGLFIAGGGRDLRIRIVGIVVTPLLAFALWQAAQPPKGWPTSAPVQKSATFLWGVIREPQTDDPGRIFVWLDVGGTQPRAYSLPYTRQLHRRVQAAMNATKHGHSIAVSRPRRGGQGRRDGQHSTVLRFYPHPPIQLPVKEQP